MEQMIDNSFHVARARALDALSLQKDRHFIGVYGEKLLHSTLKFYYQPNPDYHELSLGTMVADACVMDENGDESLFSIDDDEEFDRVADFFDDMFSTVDFDADENN